MLENVRYWFKMKIYKSKFLKSFCIFIIYLILCNHFFLKNLYSNNNLSEKQIIKLAENYFSSITTLESSFIQIASNGDVEHGKLFFRRPYQLRIDYEKPLNLSIVTSKIWIYVNDKNLKIVDAYPISESPFAPLLKEKINFESEKYFTIANIKNGIATVTFSSKSAQSSDKLSLEFEIKSSKNKIWELKRWVISQPNGFQTQITLQNTIYGKKLENKLFGVPSN